jgi:exoribonuclease R
MNGKVSVDKYPLSKIYLDNVVIEIEEKNLLNKSLDGDTVFIIDNKIDKIIKRKEFKIVGILNITSRVKFGVNKRGNPVFMFKSLNKKYPKFLVSSTITKKNKNLKDHYVVISFHKWEDNKQYPTGKIEHIIGEVGVYENEYEMILHKYNLNIKILKKKEIDIKNIEDKILDENIFSIDPLGCKDIDDALHVKEKENGYELGIHIADVSHYIHEDSDLDNKIRNRLTSIYIDGYKQINMLPNNLSTDLISLLPNQIRRVFSVIFDIDNNFNIKNIKYEKNVIKSKYAFTYEEVDNILKNKHHNLKEDILLAKKITEKIKGEEVDSHTMIETLMVLTNENVAKEICENYPKEALIRVHSGENKELFINIDKIKNGKYNKDLINHIRILSFKSAEYITCKEIKEEDIKHYGLDIKYYTHFTSPIRRYADIIVHRMLYSIIKREKYIKDNSEICKRMNDINKNIKRAERDCDKIKILKNMEDNNIKEIETEGYVTRINNNIITVYIPKYNVSQDCILINNKLKDIVDISSNENEININYLNENYKIELLDNIVIKITNIINEVSLIKKMRITVINPNLMDKFNKKN